MNKDTAHINSLENEAIYIMREVAAQFEKPVLLFSGGKDSITLVRLAVKAFYPAKIPFPLMHIDTGHNFPETIEFREFLFILLLPVCITLKRNCKADYYVGSLT